MNGVKKHRWAMGLALTVGAFLLVCAILWTQLGGIDAQNARMQAQSLEAAVRRAAVLCYAVEGRYPQSVAELKAGYGLTYDEERFIVTLNGFASNLLPTISVLAIGGQ